MKAKRREIKPRGELSRENVPILVVGYYTNDGTSNRNIVRGRITSDLGYPVDPPFTREEMGQIMLATKIAAFKILERRARDKVK